MVSRKTNNLLKPRCFTCSQMQNGSSHCACLTFDMHVSSWFLEDFCLGDLGLWWFLQYKWFLYQGLHCMSMLKFDTLDQSEMMFWLLWRAEKLWLSSIESVERYLCKRSSIMSTDMDMDMIVILHVFLYYM